MRDSRKSLPQNVLQVVEIETTLAQLTATSSTSGQTGLDEDIDAKLEGNGRI